MRLGILVAAFLTGCGSPLPEEIRGVVGERDALVQTPGATLVGRTLRVLGEDGKKILGEGMLLRSPESGITDTVELRGLSADWKSVVLVRESEEAIPLLERGKPPEPPLPPETGIGSGTILLWIFLTLYVVLNVGISGGPNHGEHPLMINILHLIAIFFLFRSWVALPFYLYLGILIVAIVLSVFVQGIRVWSEPRRTWAARAAMLALYGGLFAILLSRPERVSDARWTAKGSLQIHVRESRRGAMELVAEGGDVLARDRLGPEPRGPILYFWGVKTAPAAVRIGDESLELGDRP